jgi:hypothetical protein
MARVIFICDGCGKQGDGYFGQLCEAHKPSDWFARRDKDGEREVQIACSRRCIGIVASKTGKTACILPV